MEDKKSWGWISPRQFDSDNSDTVTDEHHSALLS